MIMDPRDDHEAAWIQTYTGRKFYPLAPRVEDVNIIDIAHSLAMQCRFTGHSEGFVSVAEHSVRVSLHCDQLDAQWGLLHDASEAYLTDLCRPLKNHSALGVEYRKIEARVQAVICERYGLDPVEPKSVKSADQRMLATEYRDQMKHGPRWDAMLIPYEWPVDTFTPPQAKRWFLDRFRVLFPKESVALAGLV